VPYLLLSINAEGNLPFKIASFSTNILTASLIKLPIANARR
jgi:hypothetical protein